MMEQSTTGRCRRSHDADWSKLSPEILSAIGNRFESRIDVCKFRSVCKNWRSSLPLPQNPRLLIPFLSTLVPETLYQPYFDKQLNFRICYLVVSTVFHVQPLNYEPNSNSKGWILAVEERKPGKLRIMHPFSRDDILKKDPSFPKHLNLLEFRVSEIGKGFFIRFVHMIGMRRMYSSDFSIEGCKAVVCLNPAQKFVHANDCTAILLYSEGTLIGLRLGSESWGYVRQSLVLRFRDVLWFKGMVYAVDDGGKLYVIDHVTLNVTETVVDHRIFEGSKASHSIRLVELSNEVYLFVDVKNVYKLNQMQHKWDKRESLGGKVVFLGFDCCFMFSAQSLLSHGGDFVIFHQSILENSYVNKSEFKEVAKDLGVYMYCLGGVCTEKSQLEVSYQAICNMLWPPPTWFWQDTMLYSRDAGEKEKIIKCGQLSQSHCNKSLEIKKVKFEGVDVRSDLVPTLQKVWAKHGNIIEGSSVYSKDMLTCVLESLAKVIRILQSSSGRSLTESQCEYIRSVVMDLKQFRLRVEWLDPFVEKALALHHSKLLADAVVQIDQNIAKATEMKMKLTKELVTLEEMEKGLKEDRSVASEKIPAVNLDQCIDDELF